MRREEGVGRNSRERGKMEGGETGGSLTFSNMSPSEGARGMSI